MMRVKRIRSLAVFACLTVAGITHASAECGVASFYSSGHRTANGESYNHMGISAAHRSLPFGSRVVVTNQRTGRSITVRINDRGPFVGGRIIDLSTGAKNALGMGGLAPVCIHVASYGNGGRARVRYASYRGRGGRKAVRYASYHGGRKASRKAHRYARAIAKHSKRYALRKSGKRYANRNRRISRDSDS